jgi:CubicO group peptidase (beta-lactamase class C family)
MMSRIRSLVVFNAVFLLCWSLHAQPNRAVNDSEARSFLDKLVTDQMATDGVLGTGVVVVKDGRLWYERGYGFADDHKTRLVDPQKTEFFAASVSKLFVATAVMQLVEEGRLDLQRDVNEYLHFRLTPYYDSRPITLADLLTHTGSVDDHMIGAESPRDEPVDLGSYFQRHVPRLVRPPASEINYSNHGVALAAHVVERTSGMTFYDYAEKRILAPLGMQHSTLRQPLPESFRNNLGFERFEKAYVIPYPIATLVTTPEDMGKFMLAHLRASPSGASILTDQALATMQAQHFSPSPELPGMAYGFFEAWAAGGRGLFHAGARDHFSLLYLVPERGFGIYIVMCGASEASQFPSKVARAFLEHLFGPASPPKTVASFAAVPRWLRGRYRLDAVSQTTLEKLVGLGPEMRVRPAGYDIDVAIPSFSRGQSTERYFQVAPLLFRSQTGSLLVFRRTAHLGETKAFRSDFVSDPMSFTRLRWFESSTVFLVTIGFSYAIFAIFLLLSLYRSIRKQRVLAQPWVWNAGALLSLCALVAPAAGIAMAFTAREHQLYTIERILRVFMFIFTPAILLPLIVLALTPSALVAGKWPLRPRLAFASLGFAALFFLRFVFYWHVWGVRY